MAKEINRSSSPYQCHPVGCDEVGRRVNEVNEVEAEGTALVRDQVIEFWWSKLRRSRALSTATSISPRHFRILCRGLRFHELRREAMSMVLQPQKPKWLTCSGTEPHCQGLKATSNRFVGGTASICRIVLARRAEPRPLIRCQRQNDANRRFADVALRPWTLQLGGKHAYGRRQWNARNRRLADIAGRDRERRRWDANRS